MRAIQITRLDGPEAIEFVDVPAPAEPGLVTIEVGPAGVAIPEPLQPRGLHQLQPDLPSTPGAEVCGAVVDAPQDLGPAVDDWAAALWLLGGFAEQMQARVDLTFRLPDEVGIETGPAVLFNYCTVYFGLIERGHLVEGETVLVRGAAGGIGTAAIRVAKAFGAGQVIAVVSTEEKARVTTQVEADEYVMTEGFRKSVGRCVDIVVDPVGGDRFTDSLPTLTPHGRLLEIGSSPPGRSPP
ncbi:zinc-binding dehydrogenase [Streptomyces sp. HUAS ZL42]|uniref:zinc-binding dehydrogenase n=1 Tax=Streptomyces sp. HUAS ZL42 TaxID=3231715 RepID=UPI00345EACD3